LPFAKLWILGTKIFGNRLKLHTFRTLFSHSSYLVTGCMNVVCFTDRIATVWYRYTREHQVDTYCNCVVQVHKRASSWYLLQLCGTGTQESIKLILIHFYCCHSKNLLQTWQPLCKAKTWWLACAPYTSVYLYTWTHLM